ncbi:MAG: polysaccharide deacetylase family protein [Lachnospiraceae bacterium]|nr:polysaccharide deacetylase family protein [Lachnospiraceae bacterium]
MKSNHNLLFKFSISFILLCAVCASYIYQHNLSLADYYSNSVSVFTKEVPIYCVKTDKPQIALSFDAAWGNQDTKTILSILKDNNVKATFFVTGGWVSEYPDDVKAIYESGNDIGNHTENHKQMSLLSEEEISNELGSVTKKVKELTGYKMTLFRPPYGDYNNRVISTAKYNGYYSIQWSVDSLDWKNYGCDNIIDTVINHKNLKNGAIILMHNGGKYTAKALPQLINKLKEAGFELVLISDLIYKENYHMEMDGCQVSDNIKTD